MNQTKNDTSTPPGLNSLPEDVAAEVVEQVRSWTLVEDDEETADLKV